MNVLIYSGPEVVQSSLSDAVSTLKSVLSPNYAVQAINQQALKSHPWHSTCALFVIPGCHHTPEAASLKPIRNYLDSGGSLLGFGTGIQVSSSSISHLNSATLGGPSTLRLFDTITSCHIIPLLSRGEKRELDCRLFVTTSKMSRSHVLQDGEREISGLDLTDGKKGGLLWAHFIGDNQEKAAAAVKCNLAAGGKAILWAPNLECPATNNGSASDSASTDETQRKEIICETLTELNLQLPQVSASPSPSLSVQYYTASPSKPQLTQRLLESLALWYSKHHKDQTEEYMVLKDNNDTFHIFNDGPAFLQARSRLAETPPGDYSVPKVILASSTPIIPPHTFTPLFDIDLYYTTLETLRNEVGLCSPDNASHSLACGMGEIVLYGEAVTSTQTMLEKNPSMTELLPSPFLSLASYQLTGRGRGSNTWLSPAGCLQFSLLLRISTGQIPANKLVFVQYLFGLAVCEACRDDAVLGKQVGEAVRLKWPNDVYLRVGDQGEMKKVGGILVNTSFTGSNVDIIIGSGLNLTTAPPMTSLSQLASLNSLSAERTTATIMVQFEKMWNTFVAHKGSFEPFMELYLQRWLHSDQQVTLTTTTPHEKVRIVGINPEYGLLRTLPERRSHQTDQIWPVYIELQPDGNSFDMMAGMIRSKT